MKEIKIIAENKNFKAIDIGPADKLSEYRFPHPRLRHIVPGKVDIAEALQTTGAEVSFSETGSV